MEKKLQRIDYSLMLPGVVITLFVGVLLTLFP
jgi:hypothetical protein